ncbi:MAG: hypothetical protein QM644_11700 [Mobilitalea sp.]
MKKMLKDPHFYTVLGLLIFTIAMAISSENLFIDKILIPLSILIQIIGVIFMVKSYMDEKKATK